MLIVACLHTVHLPFVDYCKQNLFSSFGKRELEQLFTGFQLEILSKQLA